MSNVKCYADEVGPSLSSMLTKRVDAAMCGASGYPQRTVAGMYKLEQELSKADEAGLILTAADLNPDTYHDICAKCGKPITGSVMCIGKYEVIHPECDVE